VSLNNAIPIEAVIGRRRPAAVSTDCARTAPSTESATRAASATPPRGSTIANSSPPSRASTSLSRRRVRNVCATLTISSSPTL